MSFQLMASMMCADYRNLQHEVEALDAGGIDSFHIGDIRRSRHERTCGSGPSRF